MGTTRSGFLALATLALLVGAEQAQATAVVWQSAFQPIEEMSGGGPVQTYPLLNKGNADVNLGAALGIPVPFDFHFLGSGPHSTLNVGAKGYAIPGSLSVENSVVRGDPSYLFQLLAPRNLVAAWWGDHHCRNDISTRTLGVAPNRRFVLEWDDCGISAMGVRTTFQVQLWLVEGSDAIQVRYGELAMKPGADWLRVGWGTKGSSGLGVLGPTKDGVLESCDPTLPRGTPGACEASHFPSRSTIQYGLLARADVAGRFLVRELDLAAAPARIDADLVLVNASSKPLEGVGFELFLSPAENPVPLAPANMRLLAHPPEEAVAAGESRHIALEILPERVPHGSYRLCAMLDPGGLLPENDPANDWACSAEVAHLGPDLAGSIEAPPSGAPGSLVQVPLVIWNQGNQDAGPFQYRIRAVASDGTPRQIFQERLDGLYVGESRSRTVEFELPPSLRGGLYHLELELDPNRELVDVDRDNNLVLSSGTMLNRTASLSFSASPTIELPNGCYFGEPVQATVELCNTGDAEALAFYPGLVASDASGAGVGFDPIAGASLPYCGTPGGWSFQACPLVQGRETTCAAEYCRLPCNQDADCGSGMRCLDDPELATILGVEASQSCAHRLAFGGVLPSEKCRSFQIEGRIPYVDLEGTPFSSGPIFFKVVDDLQDALGQAAPSVREIGPFECREALPDLDALQLAPLDPAVGGKSIRIWRRIANIGFTSFHTDGFTRRDREPFTYRYFLSRTADVSAHQIPLSVDGTPTGLGADALGRDESSAALDRVLIPAELEPGLYHLGLVVDPEGRIPENERRNNRRVFPNPIVVEASALSIVSGELPRAVAGRSFAHPLVATPAAAPLVWSADDLPPGLRLRGDGQLEGIPGLAGTFSFRVLVRAGVLEAAKVLALQVIDPTSGLAIETSQLPPAVRGVPYGRWFDPAEGQSLEVVRLAASGGVPPYRWELDPEVEDNLLPTGISGPTEDGLISGTATPLSVSRTFTVRVSDAMGSHTSRELSLTVLEEGALHIQGRTLPLATSAEAYTGCVTAEGGLGEVQWTFAADSIPAGLAAEAAERRLCLQGAPRVCGSFVLDLHVQDEAAGVAAASVALEVQCGSIQLNSRDLRQMSPGEEIDLQLRAIPSHGPRFKVVQGALPAGLALEEDGTLHGVVAQDVRLGVHDAMIEIVDEEGRRGLGAIAIRVEGEIAPREVVQVARPGCSSASSAAEAAWLPVGLALALLAGGRAQGRRGRTRRWSLPRWGGGRRPGAEESGGALLPRRGAVAISGLSLALALGLGCGDEMVASEVSRCAEASCEGALVCDEADGLCKCGGAAGTLCDEGEICVLEPSAHCVAPSCEFVQCDRGMRCDAASGTCLCGREACAEGERCVDGGCTAIDVCDGVICEDGLSCDPADGYCKCGETLCEGDEICVDGGCVAGRCAGVSCGVGSACDPDDGTCRCGGPGGPVCSAGESCDLEGYLPRCVHAALCDSVSCPAGETCDPDDGICRCGGVGPEHPGCTSGASCVSGTCVGGDLCAPGGAPVVCATGQSCDPIDGLCKCGGKDGVVCGEDEGCSTLAGSPACLKRCSPLASSTGCSRDDGCYLDPELDHQEAYCAPAGMQRLDQGCNSQTDCLSGLFCTRSEVCAQLCDAADVFDACPSIRPDLECSALGAGLQVGYCRAP